VISATDIVKLTGDRESGSQRYGTEPTEGDAALQIALAR
jgi:hypothetical protein